MSITTNLLVPSILVLVCTGIASFILAGKSLPLIAGPRSALVALLVLGMAACSGGIGQVGASGRWASPLAILGYLLGAAILVVIVSALAGWKLPVIEGERQALMAVAGLMLVKFFIATASYFFRWL